MLDEVPIEDWKQWMLVHVLRVGGAVPHRRASSRPTSTSTAAPSTAPPSCAPAGSAASRFVEGAIGEAVGKEYVARHFPPESKAQMDELVANLLEAYRAVDRRRWTG